MLPLLSSPLAYVFSPACFERCVISPGPVWRLPVTLGTLASNNLLSVRVHTPGTRCSLRLATRAGRPGGGDPISPTAFVNGPETSRVAPPAPRPRGNCAPLHCLGLFACRTLRYSPGLEAAPPRHEQLPRHRHNPHAW